MTICASAAPDILRAPSSSNFWQSQPTPTALHPSADHALGALQWQSSIECCTCMQGRSKDSTDSNGRGATAAACLAWLDPSLQASSPAVARGRHPAPRLPAARCAPAPAPAAAAAAHPPSVRHRVNHCHADPKHRGYSCLRDDAAPSHKPSQPCIACYQLKWRMHTCVAPEQMQDSRTHVATAPHAAG